MNNKTLIEKISQASQKIHKSSLRGSGNYIVMNPEYNGVFMAAYRIAKIKRIFSI